MQYMPKQSQTQMQYAPEHDLKELTYANENTKIFNSFKTSLYAFYGLWTSTHLQKIELICQLKWGEGPHAWGSMLDYPRHFRFASPWNLGIFNSSGHPGKQKTATLLVSVEEIEPQNIYFWRWGIYWIPIHLGLLCMEISIQIVGGQKIWHTPGNYLDKVLGHGSVQKMIFFTEAENYISRIPT